jgi:hypothetical protein
MFQTVFSKQVRAKADRIVVQCLECTFEEFTHLVKSQQSSGKQSTYSIETAEDKAKHLFRRSASKHVRRKSFVFLDVPCFALMVGSGSDVIYGVPWLEGFRGKNHCLNIILKVFRL